MERLEQEQSLLFSVPAELRIVIYEYALVTSHEKCRVTRIAFPLEPLLLRTCRRVRDEAVSVFYSQNVFTVYWHIDTIRGLTPRDPLGRWLWRLGRDKCAMIQALHVLWFGGYQRGTRPGLEKEWSEHYESRGVVFLRSVFHFGVSLDNVMFVAVGEPTPFALRKRWARGEQALQALQRSHERAKAETKDAEENVARIQLQWHYHKPISGVLVDS